MRRSSLRRGCSRIVCLASCLAAVALAGCGGTTTKTVTVAPAATTTHATGTTPSGNTTTTATVSPPLATRAASIDHQPVTLSIVDLKRSGTTAELTIQLSTKSSEQAQVADTFDDGIFQKIATPDASSIAGGDSLDGIYLIDTTNSKKYPVARDSNNACLCDTDLSDAFVANSAPMFLSATFGVPPPTVKAVNVFTPHYGTFVNVPIR